MKRKKSQRQREHEALDALVVLALHPALRELAEHDTVRVLDELWVEGHILRAGMTGTVVSVHGDGESFSVEIPELGPAVVVDLRRHRIEPI